MVDIVKSWYPQINHGFATHHSLTMVFVVKLWVYKWYVNHYTKKTCYYTFTIIKPQCIKYRKTVVSSHK